MDQATLEQHVTDLASPDPATRDDGAFAALADAISGGNLTTAQRRWLGDRMVERLSHPDAFARSFAPLIFAVLAGSWPAGDGGWPSEWSDAVLAWWPAETDLRGYDGELGWIHAVAHGADAIGTFGLAGLVPADRLLAVIAERLTAHTEFVWHDQEDDRVAGAVCAILLGDPNAGPEPLLDPVADLFAGGEPGPVPAQRPTPCTRSAACMSPSAITCCTRIPVRHRRSRTPRATREPSLPRCSRRHRGSSPPHRKSTQPADLAIGRERRAQRTHRHTACCRRDQYR
ncbi:DUF2785 domain-containing protein [Flexivirga caeni]|uniref:DUF2785 domain-containing protein n=1 Tax=Flexivirga caeni TaxID=2294115 RepID=A0A3M9M8P4_9MICO|nr:DUF2785 domain-containing protein [Flexivirga caeni]RNI21595.1 DUF2785 domain-containing protein [Flexivirga caeni]